jgi:hypothetical protein
VSHCWGLWECWKTQKWRRVMHQAANLVGPRLETRPTAPAIIEKPSYHAVASQAACFQWQRVAGSQ